MLKAHSSIFMFPWWHRIWDGADPASHTRRQKARILSLRTAPLTSRATFRGSNIDKRSTDCTWSGGSKSCQTPCVQPPLTDASCPADVGGVANLAEAPEGAHGVDTLAIRAEVRHHLTFVDVCTAGNKEKGKEVHVWTVGGTANEEEWRKTWGGSEQPQKFQRPFSLFREWLWGGEQNHLKRLGEINKEGHVAGLCQTVYPFGILSRSYYFLNMCFRKLPLWSLALLKYVIIYSIQICV